MGCRTAEQSNIPNKVYFKIGEVCQLTGVKAHTLRYWESEFSLIRPLRAISQQRLYRRVDVENILRIKKMLHNDGLTLGGTRKSLSQQYKRDIRKKYSINELFILHDIKSQLKAIKKIL